MKKLAAGMGLAAMGTSRDQRLHGGVAGVAELDAGKRAMLVDLLGNAGQHRNVLIAPEAEFDIGRDIGAVVDLHHLGADHGPAALGLHAAHGGQRRGVAIAHAVAVRHLVEAVPRRHGADAHGLEENVVAGIAGHGSLRFRMSLAGRPGSRLWSQELLRGDRG